MLNQERELVDLTPAACWALLEDEELGRLAYRLVDEVHIVPINYVVEGGSLLFRTAPGNKLLAAALEADVAFEIDWHDHRCAWSVVARGRLRRLGEDEEHRLDGLGGGSWLSSPTDDAIELTPTILSGRRLARSP